MNLDALVLFLNNNSYFIGFMMIILNLGTKYLMQDFGFIIDFVFKNKLIKRIVLFTVFFVSTRNIKVSIILTGIVVLLTLELFNEKSKHCLFPKSWMKYIHNSGKEEEIKYAVSLLKKHNIELNTR